MFWMPAGPNGPNPYPTSPPSETGSEQVGLKTFYRFVNPNAIRIRNFKYFNLNNKIYASFKTFSKPL